LIGDWHHAEEVSLIDRIDRFPVTGISKIGGAARSARRVKEEENSQ